MEKKRPTFYTRPENDWEKLTEEFFARPAVEIAPQLVGCYLSHEVDGEFKALRITEVEIYSGETDSACHARSGRTPRSSVLYKKPGTLYVYLCYGIHDLLNIVTGEEDYPEAVLIRACAGADGPGKLTRALNITRDLNDRSLRETPELAFWSDGKYHEFNALPRVGIDYADEADRFKLWRFQLRE